MSGATIAQTVDIGRSRTHVPEFGQDLGCYAKLIPVFNEPAQRVPGGTHHGVIPLYSSNQDIGIDQNLHVKGTGGYRLPAIRIKILAA